MPRGRLRQLFSIALGMLLPLGQALGRSGSRAEAKPVLRSNSPSPMTDWLLLEGSRSPGEVAKIFQQKRPRATRSKGQAARAIHRLSGGRQPAFQVTFADGIEHGPFKRWFEDGKLWVEEKLRRRQTRRHQSDLFFKRQTSVQSFYRAERRDWRSAGTRTASNAGRFTRRAG